MLRRLLKELETSPRNHGIADSKKDIKRLLRNINYVPQSKGVLYINDKTSAEKLNLAKMEKVPLMYFRTTFIVNNDSYPYLPELSNKLEQSGYALYNLYNIRKKWNGQYKTADALFINEALCLAQS
jgi:hypothetical protein